MRGYGCACDDCTPWGTYRTVPRPLALATGAVGGQWFLS